jgi:hypothetical protein
MKKISPLDLLNLINRGMLYEESCIFDARLESFIRNMDFRMTYIGRKLVLRAIMSEEFVRAYEICSSDKNQEFKTSFSVSIGNTNRANIVYPSEGASRIEIPLGRESYLHIDDLSNIFY